MSFRSDLISRIFEKYLPKKRHLVKPGITGRQVNPDPSGFKFGIKV